MLKDVDLTLHMGRKRITLDERRNIFTGKIIRINVQIS